MIDTHTHIYLPEFADDLDEIVSRSKESGVDHLILPNVDVETILCLQNTQKKFGAYCSAAMGLHPTSVEKNYKSVLDTVYEELNKSEYCGVGEIGIDLYWDKTYYKQQFDAFIKQVEWAAQRELPVIIHCRDAFEEIIKALKTIKYIPVKGVFHSFGGTPEQVKMIKEHGDFYFGINGVVTFKNAHLEDTVKEIGISRLLLETDAPYLSPVPYRGKRNEPAFMVHTATRIAEILNVSFDEINDETTKNALSLFRLSL